MKSYLNFWTTGVMLLVLAFILGLNVYRSLDYPALTSSTCFEKFTPAELKFFSEVGFIDSYQAKKWVEDIRVSTVGIPMSGDEALVDSILAELKPLIDPVKIYRSTDHSNLKIRFTDDQLERQAMGVTLFARTMVFSSKIKYAEVLIFSKVKGQARQACIRHEFLHALGLTHPLKSNTGTMIESKVEFLDEANHVKLYRYSALDKSSLRILYSDCLPAGLKKKTFMKAIHPK